jgi:hypothetical protein
MRIGLSEGKCVYAMIYIYMRRLIFLISICTGLFGCSKNAPRTEASKGDSLPLTADSSITEKVYTAATLDEYKVLYDLQRYLTDADSANTETIDFDCAILIFPTEEQIERMKKDYNEEDFYVVADDNNWYQAKAIDIIDSLGIKTITAKERYIKLKGENKNWTLDIRKDHLPCWNLVFFNRTKAPQIIPTVNLTPEKVREFFEISK